MFLKTVILWFFTPYLLFCLHLYECSCSAKMSMSMQNTAVEFRLTLHSAIAESRRKKWPRDFFGWSSVSVRNLELSGSLSERLSRKSDMTDRLLMGGLLGLHFISRNAWFKKPNPVGFWGFYWVLGFIVFFAFFKIIMSSAICYSHQMNV